MKVPEAFISALTDYLLKMQELGRLPGFGREVLEARVLAFFSAAFGYVFLKASFGDNLSGVEQQAYIKSSVDMFIHGLPGIEK